MLDIFWIYVGYVLDIYIYIYIGYVLDIFWIYFGYMLDIYILCFCLKIAVLVLCLKIAVWGFLVFREGQFLNNNTVRGLDPLKGPIGLLIGRASIRRRRAVMYLAMQAHA